MSVARTLMGTTGPFIVGTAFTTFLSGVTVMQCFAYFNKSWPSPIDRYVYRWCVIGLALLNVTHTAFCQVTLWEWFVAHYGEQSAMAKAPWSFAMSPVMCSTAAFVVQLFYAYRLYLLSKGRIVIPCLIVFGSLFQLAWGIGASSKVFTLLYFSKFHAFEYGVACWFIGAAATDLLITASLVWCLLHYKSGFRRTKSVVDRLIALTIETNGLTFTIAMMALLLFAFTKDSSHVAPTICLIQFYINSFLVSLNCRENLGENLNGSRTIQEQSRGEQLTSQQSGTIYSHKTDVCFLEVDNTPNCFEFPKHGDDSA